jgi:hypothetical protein
MEPDNGINGDPAKIVRDKLASMSMTERSQLKMGWDVRYGSRIVVYGVCFKCNRQRCENAINGTIRCPDVML